MRDTSHHLAARPVILRNSKRLAQPRRGQAHTSAGNRRRRDRDPRARCMIIGHRSVQSDSGADGDFVSDDQIGQERIAGHPVIGERKQSWKHAATCMALGFRMTVMRVEGFDGHAIGQRRARRTDATAI